MGGEACPPKRCMGGRSAPGGLRCREDAKSSFFLMFFMWRNRGGTLIGKKRIFLEIFVK
jgi:hypothetical protein